MDFEPDYDPEAPSPEDLERFGDELITCPHCGHEAYDQAEICPACCGTLHEQRTIPWWTAAVALAVAAVLVLLVVLW